MKVASKLVKMDFVIGRIERKDQYLIIISDDEKSTMSAKVRLDAEDVWAFIRSMMTWPSIKFVISLPFLLRQARRSKGKEATSD